MWLRSGRNRFESATERKYRMISEAVPMGYKLGKNVNGKSLKAGMKLVAYYNSTNEGVDVVEILGVTDNNTKHGEGGPVFTSVKQMLEVKNAKTLKYVEDVLDRESDKENGGWGYHTYLYTRDLNWDKSSNYDESGPWYYLFEGRWSRGSGAEALSFIELLPLEDEPKPVVPSRFSLLED